MTFRAPYSTVDRLLHNLAFANLGMQKMLASIEDDLFASRLRDVDVGVPIFITSLPRAGTTLLLEVLAEHPLLAAHTYRDMPFVLSPMLWDRMSRGFRKPGGQRLRAHGDDMVVGFDTPEAFEEVAWRAFWPQKYREDRIEPWSGHEDPTEFAEFFTDHMRKVVALRRGGNPKVAGRYVSKNNANISRLPTLARLFPRANVIVPVRHPLQHAASLMRQHRNFLKLHSEDAFGRRYMESIGHFEFGAALKPIDIGGWLKDAGDLSPLAADYWLTYWASAFESLTELKTSRVAFVAYEQLCAEPARVLQSLVDFLELEDPAPVLAQAGKFHQPAQYPADAVAHDPVRLERAMAAYDKVLAAALP